MNNRILWQTAFIKTLTAGAAVYFSGHFRAPPNKEATTDDTPMVKVIAPELGQIAKLGEADFNATCAACHGKNAAGSGKGPPLVHNIYRPGYHADFSFKRAAKMGVRAHHWRFGNMPAQDHVKDKEISRIIVYV